LYTQRKDFSVVTGNFLFPAIFPISPFPFSLKADENMLSFPPFPPYAKSTWKHAFSKDLLYGFVNIFLTAGVGSAELQL
jgi:hypothetical protein